MTVEGTYRTAQVAAIIGVSASSMRKYAFTIEKHGGNVQKDDKGDRIYSITDVNAFKRLRQLIAGGMTLDNAAVQAALLMQGEQEAREQAGHTLAATDGALLREALDEIKALRAEVSELRAEVGTERIKERQTFMLALNEIKAAQAATIEAKEETAAAVEEVKTGGWWKRFRK